MNPWDDEPDRKEWQAHGLKCVILRHPRGGFLCGYVGVPEDHPLHGADYGEPCAFLVARELGDLPDRQELVKAVLAMASAYKGTPQSVLWVHGGLSYAHNGLRDYEGPPLWWFGFDCAHSGDLCPNEQPCWGASYRDMAYVTRETEHLAEQLAALAKPKEEC